MHRQNIKTRTYESPVNSAYGAKGADGGNGESESVRVWGGIFLIACGRTEPLGGNEEEKPAEPLGMEVGKMQVSREDMYEEIRGEIDGGSAIEGEVRREHMEAYMESEKDEGEGRGRKKESEEDMRLR